MVFALRLPGELPAVRHLHQHDAGAARVIVRLERLELFLVQVQELLFQCVRAGADGLAAVPDGRGVLDGSKSKLR